MAIRNFLFQLLAINENIIVLKFDTFVVNKLSTNCFVVNKTENMVNKRSQSSHFADTS